MKFLGLKKSDPLLIAGWISPGLTVRLTNRLNALRLELGPDFLHKRPIGELGVHGFVAPSAIRQLPRECEPHAFPWRLARPIAVAAHGTDKNERLPEMAHALLPYAACHCWSGLTHGAIYNLFAKELTNFEIATPSLSNGS
jgi:hypothetical protein